MNNISNSQDTTALFEAVLDADRLKLIAHLSQKELSISDLSDQSEMHPKAVQHHLEVLEGANLVKSHLHDGNEIYQFNPKHIEDLNRLLFAQEKKNTIIDDLGLSKEKRKIIADYTHVDGRLKMIPTKSKKIVAILDYLSISFEGNIEYSERQVNDILEKYYPDTTTLRRYLIDYGYLGRSRNGSRYWLTGTQESDSRKS